MIFFKNSKRVTKGEVAHSHRNTEGARWELLQRESPDVRNATSAFGEHRDQNDHSTAREIRWKTSQICEVQKVPHYHSGYFMHDEKLLKLL